MIAIGTGSYSYHSYLLDGCRVYSNADLRWLTVVRWLQDAQQCSLMMHAGPV